MIDISVLMEEGIPYVLSVEKRWQVKVMAVLVTLINHYHMRMWLKHPIVSFKYAQTLCITQNVKLAFKKIQNYIWKEKWIICPFPPGFLTYPCPSFFCESGLKDGLA